MKMSEKIKVNNRIESIFSHAAVLQQQGRFRNTIHCIGREIVILNQDMTTILKFALRKIDNVKFKVPVSFNANDYDSKSFEIRKGRIVFHTSNGSYDREKSCKTPGQTPEDIHKMFSSFSKSKSINQVAITNDVLELLDDSLSHIEFLSINKKLVIIQRNIYDGTLIKITNKSGGFGIGNSESISEDFSPIGMRTNDFISLFSFINTIQLGFGNPKFIWVTSLDKSWPMEGVVGACKYDELGTIK
jgi:hypothetical protein